MSAAHERLRARWRAAHERPSAPCDWCGQPSVLTAGDGRSACLEHAIGLARALRVSARRRLRRS